MKKVAAVVITVLAITGLIGVWFIATNDNATAPTPQSTNTPSNTEPADPNEQTTFTLSEVATHNSADDCWTIIGDNVYDITSYVPRHPGGNEILLACGAHGSSLFFERQTETGEAVGSGSPHSSSAASQLETLKIGTVSE